jgi:hypothetical protein
MFSLIFLIYYDEEFLEDVEVKLNTIFKIIEKLPKTICLNVICVVSTFHCYQTTLLHETRMIPLSLL